MATDDARLWDALRDLGGALLTAGGVMCAAAAVGHPGLLVFGLAIAAAGFVIFVVGVGGRSARSGSAPMRDPQALRGVTATTFAHPFAEGCFCLGLTVRNAGRKRIFHAAIVDAAPGQFLFGWVAPPDQIALGWVSQNELSIPIGRRKSANLLLAISISHTDLDTSWPTISVVARVDTSAMEARPITPSIVITVMVWNTHTKRSITRKVGLSAASRRAPIIAIQP